MIGSIPLVYRLGVQNRTAHIVAGQVNVIFRRPPTEEEFAAFHQQYGTRVIERVAIGKSSLFRLAFDVQGEDPVADTETRVERLKNDIRLRFADFQRPAVRRNLRGRRPACA